MVVRNRLRNRLRFRRRRSVMATAAGAAALVLNLGSAPGQTSSSISWNAVGGAIGTTLKAEAGDVHTAEWLRTDLHVVNAGVTENPGMELNAEASFHQTTAGRAVMIGEVTLTAGEVQKVVDRLQGAVQARGAGGEQADHLQHPAAQGGLGDAVRPGQVGKALVMAQMGEDEEGLAAGREFAPARADRLEVGADQVRDEGQYLARQRELHLVDEYGCALGRGRIGHTMPTPAGGHTVAATSGPAP